MTETENNTFNFELVSPAKKLVETSAFQVVVPGQEGALGVRKGHASFVVAMRAGVVEILKDQNATPERIFVAGGFADISADNTTILAEEAIPVAELDKTAIEAEIVSLKEKMEEIKDNKSLEALHIAQEKLRA